MVGARSQLTIQLEFQHHRKEIGPELYHSGPIFPLSVYFQNAEQSIHQTRYVIWAWLTLPSKHCKPTVPLVFYSSTPIYKITICSRSTVWNLTKPTTVKCTKWIMGSWNTSHWFRKTTVDTSPTFGTRSKSPSISNGFRSIWPILTARKISFSKIQSRTSRREIVSDWQPTTRLQNSMNLKLENCRIICLKTNWKPSNVKNRLLWIGRMSASSSTLRKTR